MGLISTVNLSSIKNNDFAIAEYTVTIRNWQNIEAIGNVNYTEALIVQVRIKLQVVSGVTAYFDENNC